MSATSSGDGACSVVYPATKNVPKTLRVTYHPPAIVNNEWQPYDQPDGAAYMPWGLDELEIARLRSGGAVLVYPRRRPLPLASTLIGAVTHALRVCGAPPAAIRAARRMLKNSGPGRRR